MASSDSDTSSVELPRIIAVEMPTAAGVDFPRSLSPVVMNKLHPHPRTTSNSSKSSSSTSILLYSSRDSDSAATINSNVKFAPLPKLDPRKRQSSVPLGIANRGRLVRRRRSGEDENGRPIQVYTSPFWTQDETGRQTRAGSNLVVVEDLGLEDPFAALGKLMRSASRKVWKQVSKKKEDGAGTDGTDSRDESDVNSAASGKQGAQTERSTSNDEDVNDEENRSTKTVCQTETIRDGEQLIELWPGEGGTLGE